MTNNEPNATDAEIREWLERHDLTHALPGSDARAAFEDAQTFKRSVAAPAQPKVASLIADIQQRLASIEVPKMTESRAEYFKAGARAAIAAVNAALTGADPT